MVTAKKIDLPMKEKHFPHGPLFYGGLSPHCGLLPAFTDTLLHKGKVPVTENGSLPSKNVSLFKDAPRAKLCGQTSVCQLLLP